MVVTSENILKELNKAVKALHFYPDNHPNLKAAIDTCYSTLTDGLALREKITWTIDKRGFYEGQEELLPNQGWLISLAREFFLRHIMGITFSRGFSLEEFTTFLSLMKEEPETLLEKGSFGAQIADRGINGLAIEDVHYQEVHKAARDVSEEEKENDPSLDFMPDAGEQEVEEEPLEEESVDSVLQGFENIEEKEKSLAELLKELERETDSGYYHNIATELCGKVTRYSAAEEWSVIFSILDTFLRHSLPEGKKPEKIASIARDSLRELLWGDIVTHLIKRLLESVGEECASTQKLLLLSEKEGMSRLLDSLATIRDSHTRRFIYDTLLLFGETLREEVERRTSDERWYVVRQMVALLGEIGSPHSLESLGNVLEHTDLRVRKEAIKSLGRVESEDSATILIATLDDADRSLVPSTIVALGALRRASAIEPLGLLAHRGNALSSNLDIRKEAVKALGLIGDEQAIPILSSLLNKRVWFGKQDFEDLRALSIISLGKIGGEAAIGIIEEMAKDAQGIVKRACDKTLKELE